MTTSGQRVATVSASQVPTIAKGLIRLQPIVASTMTTTPVTVNNTRLESVGRSLRGYVLKAALSGVDKDGKKTVDSQFINKLYANQSNSLDVRWKRQQKQQQTPPSRRSRNHGQQEDCELEIKDYYRNKLDLIARINERRCSAVPLYGKDFQDSIKVYKCGENPAWGGGRIHCLNALFNMNTNNTTDCLRDMLYSPERRIDQLSNVFQRQATLLLLLLSDIGKSIICTKNKKPPN